MASFKKKKNLKREKTDSTKALDKLIKERGEMLQKLNIRNDEEI